MDNVDDLETFDYRDFIPKCLHGSVIITSRMRSLEQNRTDDRATPISLEIMSAADSLRLLSSGHGFAPSKCNAS
jgi:hypothetical protein